jgi:hypothetical protein
MYSLVSLVSAGEAARAALSERLRALGGVVAPVLEGNFNGGDVAARFSFGDEAAYRAARAEIDAAVAAADASQHNWAFFKDGVAGVADPGLATGVWRGLLLCADRPQAAQRQAEFEAEMVLMPKCIPAIRNWRFSRALESGGDLGWTHVWEQEYADLGGLMGPYMLHPYHWALIDRWFDPECPDWIVNTHLCHSFSLLGTAVLS